MVEVKIDSVRVSLMSQHRVVVLKDISSERYLTIFIGPCEADAITIHLQHLHRGGPKPQRPMTHDLLLTTLETLGGKVQRIHVNDLRDEIYFAEILVDINGEEVRIDSRPSDAIALAVRAEVPIFVAEGVMERAASTPDEELTEEEETPAAPPAVQGEDDLDIFRNFVETLDMDDLEDDEDA